MSARQEGLEPPTGGLEIRSSVRLSYWRRGVQGAKSRRALALALFWW